jgi:hypothetical protein
VEQLKEQLRYETELLRLAWITALAVGGGNASLILGGITFVRAVLLAIGVLLIVVFASVGVRQDRTIRSLLRELEGKQ